jgi:chromosome partitioning protein
MSVPQEGVAPRLARVYARLIRRAPAAPVHAGAARPYRVVTVANPKGGVGKTTLATNLAVYARAFQPDLPVLILGLDDQSLIDRMFGSETPGRTWRTVATGLRRGSFRAAIRPGRYGVHWVPTGLELRELSRSLEDSERLATALARTAWQGLVVVDTKGDLDMLTRNAIEASDLVLVPVKDAPSLWEAARLFDWMRHADYPWERARAVLSMVDRRVKFREGESSDVLALLVAEIRRRHYPLCETFLSSSPAVEALSTNPEGRPRAILEGAPGSLVHRQMQELVEAVLKLALAGVAEPEDRPDSRPGQERLGSAF